MTVAAAAPFLHDLIYEADVVDWDAVCGVRCIVSEWSVLLRLCVLVFVRILIHHDHRRDHPPSIPRAPAMEFRETIYS